MDHDQYLDITSDICPMTFVRAKLLLERMAIGEIALICLNYGEPLENVPKSLREHGYDIRDLRPAQSERPQGKYYLTVAKT
jgi:TusA-related sulfurtransferase